MNEIANIAERVGADVELVRQGIGSDPRIGYHFIYPGAGYGGSCFPKDVQALVHQMKCIGIEPLLLSGIEQVNWRQKMSFAKRIMAACEGIDAPTIAVWGLAFKADTDDIREAPAFEVIKYLVDNGAKVKTYDPEAMPNSRKALGGKVTFCNSLDECTKDADAAALITDWPVFITQDWHKVAKLMKGKHIFDGRNCLASGRVTDAGLFYHAVGRPELKPGEGRPGAIGIVNAG
jgi:UDPglucose 6-dehydrogenase